MDVLVSVAELVPKDVRVASASGAGSPSVDLARIMVPRDLLERGPSTMEFRHALPVSLCYSTDWITDFWDPQDASQKPMRCFSCGRCLGHRYTPYFVERFIRGHDVDQVLDLLGIEPNMYCCKQMLLTYVSVPVKPVAKGHKIIVGE